MGCNIKKLTVFCFLDEGGIFKAKEKNNETKGATEVEESADTKVELPIDQVEAEEVKVNYSEMAVLAWYIHIQCM